jgi:hypothetical protein
MKTRLIPAALLLACACAPLPKEPLPGPRPMVVVEEDPAWRRIASQEDAARLDRLDEAWTTALGEVRRQGLLRALREEGALLDPAAALFRPEPTPGPYRCRTIKLGSQTGRSRAFTAYRSFTCYVNVDDNNVLTIVKQTGSERPAGRFYPDKDERRLVFLGALSFDAEPPIAYGARSERDAAGVLQRIDAFRFRLVIPWPKRESKLDVIELVAISR